MSNETGIRIIPPVYMASLAIIAYGLHHLWDLQLSEHGLLKMSGIALVVLAFILTFWAMFTFKQFNTTIDVRKTASKLVTQGPFRFSRNPIYMAALVLFIGIGVWLNNYWFCLAAVILQQILARLIIPVEEHFLKKNFTAEYESYCQQVRRWL
ncbi:MAG: isoprenylcysteine carboxylmethyltransferase family protein [Gammaproteobacteria bacterium]|nr:isoprenylcysteine carboxylmethyltransferase family protein [Gammaproteobacteria bacterium]